MSSASYRMKISSDSSNNKLWGKTTETPQSIMRHNCCIKKCPFMPSFCPLSCTLSCITECTENFWNQKQPTFNQISNQCILKKFEMTDGDKQEHTHTHTHTQQGGDFLYCLVLSHHPNQGKVPTAKFLIWDKHAQQVAHLGNLIWQTVWSVEGPASLKGPLPNPKT